MARLEESTDLWVDHLLNDAGVKLDCQSSRIKNIDEALHTGSKRLNGKPGYPEYVGVVKDFLLVIEDKSSLDTVRIVVTAYSPNISRRSVRCLSPEESLRGTVRVPLNNSKSNQNHNATIIKISDYGQI